MLNLNLRDTGILSARVLQPTITVILTIGTASPRRLHCAAAVSISEPSPARPGCCSPQRLKNPASNIAGLGIIPKMAELKPYQYESIPSTTSIRLLKVIEYTQSTMVCTLETFSLDECPIYVALSYTWGPPIDDVEYLEQYGEHVKLPIEILNHHHNDNRKQGLLAGRNVFEGLHRVFTSGHRELIWVDALCIDQESAQERAEQVGLMGDIFAKCESVIIWLGKSDTTAEDFVWLIKTIVPALEEYRATEDYEESYNFDWDSEMMAEKFRIESPEQRWLSLFEFYTYRRYWHRAWIVQEIALAKNLLIYCGEHLMEWNELVSLRNMPQFAQNICSKIAEDVRNSARPVTVFDGSLGGEVSRISQLRWNVALGGPEGEVLRQELNHLYGATSQTHRYWAFIIYLLAWTRPFIATDARDNIFSVLGIANRFRPHGVDALIEARYDLPAGLVYQKVTAKLLESLPGLRVLSLVEDRITHATNEALNLPSWVPNFACLKANMPMFPLDPMGFFNASANMRRPAEPAVVVRGSRLLLQGTSYDGVHSAVSYTTLPALPIEAEVMPMLAKYLADILCIASSLNPVYKTGDGQVDAFWMALLCGNCPSGKADDYRIAFYDYIIYSLATQLQLSVGVPALKQHTERCLQYINTLNEAGGMQLPSRLHVELFSRLIHQNINSPSDDSILWIQLAEKRPLVFETLLTVFQDDRAFFRTIGGHLGTGPKYMQEGDELWLFPDARVFFILRPVPDDDCYWLIGEAYVYGAMNGEMIARHPDRELKTACII